MTASPDEIARFLSGKINLPDIREVNRWADTHEDNLKYLFSLAGLTDSRSGVNALWSLTHMMDTHSEWMQSHQDEFIDMLLTEKHVGRRRMLLQLLRHQHYAPDAIRTDFLDYCLLRINSECEPYAIRCFSMYCAFEMCKFYPELLAELSGRLDMLSQQSLSPGLASALLTTRKNMRRHMRAGS